MHETVISHNILLSCLKTKSTARCPQHTFITKNEQITKNNKKCDECSASRYEIQIATLNTDCEHVMLLKRYLNFKNIQLRSVNVP